MVGVVDAYDTEWQSKEGLLIIKEGKHGSLA